MINTNKMKTQDYYYIAICFEENGKYFNVTLLDSRPQDEIDDDHSYEIDNYFEGRDVELIDIAPFFDTEQITCGIEIEETKQDLQNELKSLGFLSFEIEQATK